MESTSLTYLLLGLCAAVFLGSFVLNPRRVGPKLARLGTPLALVAMLGAYFVLRPGSSADVSQLKASALADNKLLFLSFHSNH